MLWAVLVLLTLMTARLARLITADYILLPFRRWVVNKWGDESALAYLVHCVWCTGIWVSFPFSVIWTWRFLPVEQWWIGVPAWLGTAYAAGLLSRLEEK